MRKPVTFLHFSLSRRFARCTQQICVCLSLPLFRLRVHLSPISKTLFSHLSGHNTTIRFLPSTERATPVYAKHLEVMQSRTTAHSTAFPITLARSSPPFHSPTSCSPCRRLNCISFKASSRTPASAACRTSPNSSVDYRMSHRLSSHYLSSQQPWAMTKRGQIELSP